MKEQVAFYLMVTGAVCMTLLIIAAYGILSYVAYHFLMKIW